MKLPTLAVAVLCLGTLTTVAGRAFSGVQQLALTGFTYEGNAELTGFYSPQRTVRVGKFELDSISVAPPADFESFASGARRSKTYAPMLVEFSDVTSRKGTTELGQEYYENSPRVLPRAYRVTLTGFEFVGRHPQLGVVTFKGTLDLSMLRLAKEPTTAHPTVLTGDITFGGQTVRHVEFNYFEGE